MPEPKLATFRRGDEMARWLITGASSGIGAAVATEAAAAGNSVALVARRENVEEVASSVRDEGGEAVAIREDLAEPGSVPRIIDFAKSRLGGIDVLVNNAGLHRGGRIERLEEEDFTSVLELGLVVPFRLCRALVSGMPAGGAIVNIGAVVGLRGFPGDSPYGSAKAGLAGLTRVLAIELARRRITANLVVPGFTETEMTAEVDDRARETILERIPLGRTAEPAEVARVVRWVAETPYMTGAVIPVDGGLMAGFGSS
jgi:3-oxoacyl-[acyl-carrier protein] reductase